MQFDKALCVILCTGTGYRPNIQRLCLDIGEQAIEPNWNLNREVK